MNFIAENNVNYWPTPAESPDRNPIEMLWHKLKSFLRRVVKLSNKEFWDSVAPNKCAKYISHLQKVILPSFFIKAKLLDTELSLYVFHLCDTFFL